MSQKVLPHMVIKLNSTLQMIITPGCNYQSNRQSCKQGFKRWDLLSILKPNFDTFLVTKRRNDRHWREMVRAGQGTLNSRLYTPPPPQKKKRKIQSFSMPLFFSERATWEAYVDRCVPPLQREKNASFPRRRRLQPSSECYTKLPIFLFFVSFFALKCAGFWGLPAAGKPSPPSHIKSQTSSVTSHFYQGNGCDRALLGVANQAWLFVAVLQSEAVAVRLCLVRRLRPTSEMVVFKKYK